MWSVMDCCEVVLDEKDRKFKEKVQQGKSAAQFNL